MVLFVLHDPDDCLDESIGSFHQRFSLCEWPVKHDGNEHLCSIFLMRAACRPASAPGCAHRDSTLQELDDLLGEYDLKRDLVEINRKAPNGLTMQCGVTIYGTKARFHLATTVGGLRVGYHTENIPYEVKDNDIRRAVMATTAMPAATLPETAFLLALGTPALRTVPPQTGSLAQRAIEEWVRYGLVILLFFPLFLLPYLVKMIQCYHSCINLPWTGTCHAFVWLFCLGFCALLLFGGFAFGFCFWFVVTSWQPTGLCAGPIPVHSWGPSISRRPCMR